MSPILVLHCFYLLLRTWYAIEIGAEDNSFCGWCCVAYKGIGGDLVRPFVQTVGPPPPLPPLLTTRWINAGAPEHTSTGVGTGRRVAGTPQRRNEGDPRFPSTGVPPWAGRLRAFPKSGKDACLVTVGARSTPNFLGLLRSFLP